MTIKIKIKKLSTKSILPKYSHPGDAGMNLFSIERKHIKPGDTALIKTGISIELPFGTEAQIRPRSGLALKSSITVLNTPGTIDCGYRGEIVVILINHGENEFLVSEGMKIAQMVIKEVPSVEIEEVSELTSSSRGTGGFGSTGK